MKNYNGELYAKTHCTMSTVEYYKQMEELERERSSSSKEKWVGLANAHLRNGNAGLYYQCLSCAERGVAYPYR